MMVFIATVPAGALAMKVSLPPTPEDIARLAALCALPGLEGATWTAREGFDVR
jgi:hypothetical protein